MKTLDDIQLPDEVRALLDRLVEVTKELCDPEAIILFGSWAEGRATKDSDLDVLVICETNRPAHVSGRIRWALIDWLHPMDILVYTPEEWHRKRDWPHLFASDAYRKGVLLHGAAA
jgi:predicted nucleotidyltransferase